MNDRSFVIEGRVLKKYIGQDSEVIVPDGVNTIGKDCFRNSKLRKIRLPDGLTAIKDGAFHSCSELTRITVPASVEQFGDQAFAGCSKLTSAGPIGSGCSYEFGHTAELPARMFFNMQNLSSVQLPDSVEVIGARCFWNCKSLTEVRLPERLVRIEADAFSSCAGLRNIRFPETLTSIGDYAFADCTGLSSVRFPENLTSIGNLAFLNCTGLQRFAAPESAKCGNRIIAGCRGLADEDGFLVFQNVLCDYLENAEVVFVPEGIAEIGFGAFHRGPGNLAPTPKIQRVILPKGTRAIRSRAFTGLGRLTEIVIPDSVTVIEDEAVYNCEMLKRITLPGGIKQIGEKAFPLKTEIQVSGKASAALQNYLRNREEKKRAEAEKRKRQIGWPVSQYSEAMDVFAQDHGFRMSAKQKEALLRFLRAFLGSKFDSNCTRFRGEYRFELEYFQSTPGFHDDHDSETSVSLLPIGKKQDGWSRFTKNVDMSTGNKPRIYDLLSPCREIYVKHKTVWDHIPGIFGTSLAPGTATFCVLDPPGLKGWFELEYTIEWN